MYNSTDIDTNLKEAKKALEKVTDSYEIILVNDGSTNNCLDSARKIKDKKIKVVSYEKNRGKGYAIKYGFNFTTGDYIAFVDCGRDLNPKQLKDFLDIIKDKKADIVIGSKKHPESKVNYPLIRRFMSRTYQLLNKIFFNLNVQDTQVGLKLFKRSALEKIMPRIAIKSFAFDLELLVIAQKYGFKIIEAPITMRFQFKSTINVFNVSLMLWDTLAIFYRSKILRYYD
jgi:glycosyltransferase involved in cell wall biosynthesis